MSSYYFADNAMAEYISFRIKVKDHVQAQDFFYVDKEKKNCHIYNSLPTVNLAGQPNNFKVLFLSSTLWQVKVFCPCRAA